ncbi:hypothetical protein [Micromonospora sp. LOL_024]|uniref:hypothetical protein n=1 Tax=Micromonospora sp. LOL_024 TaxID=3345412 RepID=UPI003A86420E
MQFRASLRAAVVVAAMLVAGGLSSAPAHAADPTVQPDPTSIYIEMDMKRVGVDHKIAKANGYEVRVDSNGIEYAVKEGEVTTFDEKTGTCGSSFVYLTAVDTKKHYTSIYTGYTILPSYPGAIYTDWAVGVIDSYGSSTKTWSDPSLPTRLWAKTHGFTSSGPGWVYADVLLGSIATLANGTICFSHGPSARAYL